MAEQTAMTVRQTGGELLCDEVLSPVMNLAVAKQRLKEFQEFVGDYLVKDEDFGIIPGTPKPCLLKPGADKLCELYGLSDSYEIVDKVEDYDAKPPLFDYTVRCILTRIRNGVAIASGLGSCSTYESKYRWRNGSRRCPQCGAEAIIKGKAEYGGGFLCFNKKGGCGAKFEDNDPKITKQVVGRVENEDIIDQKNTVLKMAKKRAKVDATLAATRSSGIFTQDEDVIQQRAEQAGNSDPQTGNPPAAGRGKAPGKAPAKGKAAPPPATDVMCSQCRGINGHLPDCPTQQRNSPPPAAAAPAPANNQRILFVNGIEEKETKAHRKYLLLDCTDRQNMVVQVFCYHDTPRMHAPKWVGKWCQFVLSEKPSADGKRTFISLESILMCENQSYVNNSPVPEDESLPISADEMGF